jgi:hypothetical protein
MKRFCSPFKPIPLLLVEAFLLAASASAVQDGLPDPTASRWSAFARPWYELGSRRVGERALRYRSHDQRLAVFLYPDGMLYVQRKTENGVQADVEDPFLPSVWLFDGYLVLYFSEVVDLAGASQAIRLDRRPLGWLKSYSGVVLRSRDKLAAGPHELSIDTSELDSSGRGLKEEVLLRFENQGQLEALCWTPGGNDPLAGDPEAMRLLTSGKRPPCSWGPIRLEELDPVGPNVTSFAVGVSEDGKTAEQVHYFYEAGREDDQPKSGPGYDQEPYFVLPGVVEPPRRIGGLDPVVTEMARGQPSRNWSAAVWLQLLVSRTGEVDQVEFKKGLPYGLSEAAYEAALTWRYEPATKDGVPVAVRLPVPARNRTDLRTDVVGGDLAGDGGRHTNCDSVAIFGP